MSSQWWEFEVLGDPALDELLTWQIQAMGCQGTSSQITAGQLKICGYFPTLQVTEAALQEMAQQVQQRAAEAELAVHAVHWHMLEEEDWASSWKDYWHPTEVGDLLLILPAWLPLPKTDRIVLRLDPGVAFGTGAHATTQLCLTALEAQFTQSVQTPFVFADIGCGTGILAIAALKLGADLAYAVDTDPLAVQAAQACRDLNNIPAEQMRVAEGSIDRVITQINEPVDGLCCNILAHVIIDLIPQMGVLVKPQGWGILSGILQSQVPAVADALAQNGWDIRQTWQQADWACLKVQQVKSPHLSTEAL